MPEFDSQGTVAHGPERWPNHLARLIHERRLARGLTMEALAEAAGFGRNREKIATIISGHWPKHGTLVALLDALDIPIAEVYPLPESPTVGQVLETMRLRRGLRLDDVGAAIGITGTQVRRIERDLSPRSPSIPGLLAFFGASGIRTYEREELPPFSQALQRALDERKLSLDAAAHLAELDAMTILMILRGHKPSYPTASKLQQAFDVPLELARPIRPNASLADQLRTLKWHADIGIEAFARQLRISESSLQQVVANGVIGDRVAERLAEVHNIPPEAWQLARSRHVRRMLEQARAYAVSTSLLGRLIDERCISLGLLPGAVARQLGIHPAVFRRFRRGARPNRREVVERIMAVLDFSAEQREAVLAEWHGMRAGATRGTKGAR